MPRTLPLNKPYFKFLNLQFKCFRRNIFTIYMYTHMSFSRTENITVHSKLTNVILLSVKR